MATTSTKKPKPTCTLVMRDRRQCGLPATHNGAGGFYCARHSQVIVGAAPLSETFRVRQWELGVWDKPSVQEVSDEYDRQMGEDYGVVVPFPGVWKGD